MRGTRVNFLFVLGAVFLFWGFPVPHINEEHYLAVLVRAWDPGFLANDWTFSTTLPDRWIFNMLFGSLTTFLPLEVVAWIGRIGCWVLGLIALFRLGRHLEVPAPLISLALVLWLIFKQSLVGGAWMIGPFEAKSVAYVCFLFALDGALAGRLVRAAVLAGLAVTFHPAVGLVATAALAVGLLASGLKLSMVVRPLLVGLAFALPGLVQTWLMMVGSDPSTSQDWDFLSATFMKIHFDPSSFTRGLVILTVLTFAFNGVWAYRMREKRAFRTLFWFQVVLAVPAIAGTVGFALGHHAIMTITPYRLFPLFSLLFFFLNLSSLLASWRKVGPGRIAPVLLVVTLLGFPEMFQSLRDHGRNLERAWTAPEDDYSVAFRWLSSNTPHGTVGIIPPWRGDAALKARRGQVVQWAMPRYDHLSQWRQRVESSVAEVPADILDHTVRDTGEVWRRMIEQYHRLGPGDVQRAVKEYGVSFFVTVETYPYPVIFQAGAVRVYDLAGIP